MHENPWIALDLSTNPGARARELRLARERFLQDQDAVSGIRPPIAESWRRSVAAGADPTLRLAPVELAEDDAHELLREHPLRPLAAALEPALRAISGAGEHVLAVSDADGLLLWVDGDARARAAAAQEMNMVAGARFSEPVAGTNAIGTALAADHPVQVFAAEHFSEHSQWWTCVAAPIRDPATRHVLGAVNVTARMETVHPASLGLVVAVASMFEASLGEVPEGGLVLPSGRPPATVAIDALGRDRASVALDGRDLGLSLRHSEILVLLAAHPAGLTAEQLAIALHGDSGKPVTARAELSRLRRLLPDCIGTEPYRLAANVDGDFAQVRRLLEAGRVGDAVARYPGALLPRSEAPGVAEIRQELDGWIRRSVMGAEDVEALWAWLGTPSGADDLSAWKRFLANLPYGDGRRGLAAARLERLRALFGPELVA
jgi:hypothetical protein